MPKGSKVAHCVKKVMKKGKDKVSAIKICQTSTGQSYKTGKPSKTQKESVESNISEMIRGVCDKDYSNAFKALQAAVEEKLKNRIRNISEMNSKKTDSVLEEKKPSDFKKKEPKEKKMKSDKKSQDCK